MKTIDELTPTEFENLTFDLICATGFRSVVWRTPGSDRGRDIEAIFHNVDACGSEFIEKWYIECKHYKSAISWPIVYHKVAHADAHGANFLLMVSNSNPSPSCEDEINNWNLNRYPKIRFWKGYQLESILRPHKALAAKYQLVDGENVAPLAIYDLAKILLGLIQSLQSCIEFNVDPSLYSRASESLGFLISRILDDYSKSPEYSSKSNISFEEILNIDSNFDGVLPDFTSDALIAIVDLLAVETNSLSIGVSNKDADLIFSPKNPKLSLSKTGHAKILNIAIWGNFEIEFISESLLVRSCMNG